jgi:hypothetical protein
MQRGSWLLPLFLLPAVLGFGGERAELLPPVQVQAGGKALDVQHEGHAAPFIGDFYEDGGLCLLVGQFEDGRLRIYRNMGTRAKPRFDSYAWF